jgi:hypothetical protein
MSMDIVEVNPHHHYSHRSSGALCLSACCNGASVCSCPPSPTSGRSACETSTVAPSKSQPTVEFLILLWDFASNRSSASTFGSSHRGVTDFSPTRHRPRDHRLLSPASPAAGTANTTTTSQRRLVMVELGGSQRRTKHPPGRPSPAIGRAPAAAIAW